MKSAAKKITVVKTSGKPQAKAAGRGLGKGLSALMSESYSQTMGGAAAEEGERMANPTLAIDKVRPGKYQPRGFFDEAALGELTDSIRKNGIMQPILVRPVGGGDHEIIAGERRWRAARMAGLKEIPVLIREITDEQALELALVENVQRQDLQPLEEAAGYQRLMDDFGYTQEELSATVHKSRSHIANFLRMLELPQEVQAFVSTGQLSAGHARALAGAGRPGELAAEIVRRGLNVRQTEKLIRAEKDFMMARPEKKPKPDKDGVYNVTYEEAVRLGLRIPSHNPKDKDPDILALEETLSENLGLKVSIDDRGQSGEINIKYESLEQLDEILRRLGGSV